ncbi:hypothetical protein [Chryseobacterium indoltheticum]|uniref:Uncharacterized protein n=1 Tax=Chryseobacterium indoltheticum TaxID=254 RepID=A0A381F3V4_9FLAO|nr:hypothetical protein [Chryseobacterium indoltheticum]AZA74803.1 hypothetical protein EG358_13965 [Chryseobacterium indoltheticum]SIQ34746.1 hypothetical protein SAMN05421682_104172 [Chryseobacterium indoltheticum]SUX41240.1 Uncharacterised protein [Chryseobacterium indoltheticum]
MENEELERQILEIVTKKHDETGGNNGNGFGDFDHILKMSIEDRNSFIKRLVDEKKIAIRMGPNARMIMLPKN